MSGKHHTPVDCLPHSPHIRISRYPLNERLGGPLSRSERCGAEININPLPGFESRAVHPAAVSLNYDVSAPLDH